MSTTTRKRELELARNKRRNKKYKEDDAYRAEIRRQSRERYVAKNGKANCNREALTKPSVIKLRGLKRGDQVVFDAQKVALVLGGYNVHVIFRWIREGNLPKMIHEASRNEDGSGGVKAVYSLEEMIAIAKIMNHHQINISCYFGKSQPRTVKKIAQAIEEIREG